MKHILPSLMTIAACCAVTGLPQVLNAQSDSIKAKELQVKEKELDLEKAKIDAAKSEQLAVEKAKVELAQKELELAKARQDLAVKETSSQIQMQLSGDVLFDTNEATLKNDAREKLRQVGVILAAYPEGHITVIGYTDARGSEETNLELSRKRAESVKTWLMNQSGVKDERFTVKALGEENSVASNSTATGRQQNRRVEISVNKGL